MLDISKCAFDDFWTEHWYDLDFPAQVYYFTYEEFYSGGKFDRYRDDPRVKSMDLRLEIFSEDGQIHSNLAMAVCVDTGESYSSEDWTPLVYGEDYDDIFLANLFDLGVKRPVEIVGGRYEKMLRKIRDEIKEVNHELESRI